MSLSGSHDLDGLKMTFVRQQKSLKFEKSFKFNQHTENFVEQSLTCSHSSEFKNCVNFLNLCSFLFVFYVIVHPRVLFYLAISVGQEKTTIIVGFQKK